MWECGLKQNWNASTCKANVVTPYVGVWIETKGITVLNGIAKSLLMWECGLKQGPEG